MKTEKHWNHSAHKTWFSFNLLGPIVTWLSKKNVLQFETAWQNHTIWIFLNSWHQCITQTPLQSQQEGMICATTYKLLQHKMVIHRRTTLLFLHEKKFLYCWVVVGTLYYDQEDGLEISGKLQKFPLRSIYEYCV